MEAKEKGEVTPDTNEPEANWRIKTGFTIFIASIVWPVLLPILPLFGVSGQSVATLTGIMVVVAEVMMVTAAAISGKEGFAYIKKRIFGFLKSHGPPQTVSAARYHIGLILLCLPLLFAFLAPYIGHYLTILGTHRMAFAVAGDILLLVGLLTLGGDFWDKLRSLFLHKAVAVMPDKTAE
jgi:hypothetical protein